MVESFALEERWVESIDGLPAVLREVGVDRLVRVGFEVIRGRVLVASMPESARKEWPTQTQAVVSERKDVIDIGSVECPESEVTATLVEADVGFELVPGALQRIVAAIRESVLGPQQTTLLLASTAMKRTHWIVRSNGIQSVRINMRSVDAIRFFGDGMLAARNSELYVKGGFDGTGQWRQVQVQNGGVVLPLDDIKFLSRVHGSVVAVTTSRKIVAIEIIHPERPVVIGRILTEKRGKKGVVQRYIGRLGGAGEYVATVCIDPRRPREPVITLCRTVVDPIKNVTDALSGVFETSESTRLRAVGT